MYYRKNHITRSNFDDTKRFYKKGLKNDAAYKRNPYAYYHLQIDHYKQARQALSMTAEIVCCIITGFAAGLATGLSSISAAIIISPVLITFLDVPAYAAVGIALAADIFSSTASAIMYGKNRHVNFRGSYYLLMTTLVFTVLGSYIGAHTPDNAIGYGLIFSTTFLGGKFLVAPVKSPLENIPENLNRKHVWTTLLSGAVIGLISGIFGIGGGLMILIALVFLLQYELKTALGTSLYIMAFTALIGAFSHFIIGGVPDLAILTACICSATSGAWFSSMFANRTSAKILNVTVGILLLGIGLAMLFKQCYGLIK